MVAPITQLEEDRSIRLAKSPSGFDDGFEYRLQLVRRPGNHGQNVTDGGLVFERFQQLALARLLGLKQPRVLDGDDYLVSKSFQQCNLSISKRLDFVVPSDTDYSNYVTLLNQRHSESSPSGLYATLPKKRKVGVVLNIEYMNHGTVSRDPADDGFSPRAKNRSGKFRLN